MVPGVRVVPAARAVPADPAAPAAADAAPPAPAGPKRIAKITGLVALVSLLLGVFVGVVYASTDVPSPELARPTRTPRSYYSDGTTEMARLGTRTGPTCR